MIAVEEEPSSSSVYPAPSEKTVAFLDRLYAKRDEYLAYDPFSTIGEAPEFFTKIVGVTFEGRQDVIGGLTEDAAIDLRRMPDNPADPNAIGVFYGALHLGYLRAAIARRLAPVMDTGGRYTVTIGSLTGGNGYGRSYGVNLCVRRERERRERATPLGASRFSAQDMLRSLIGDAPLRPAQRAVLDRVESGRNTLAVLGTGRGKSLCFQYPAAVGALERGLKTVVLYPLRALANDQFAALTRRLDKTGLRILRANGAIDVGERAALMSALESGSWDIICSTPEFFGHHLGRFNHAASRPGLVVVDESHHVFESKHRPAFGKIGQALEAIGSPQVLALTATANDEAFATIVDTLKIATWVIDPTVRTNLCVIDARETTNKVAYIAKEAATGKAIVYCNSRNEATKIAERLRAAFGDVAFYHAGVATAERTEIERMFREGALRVVVATSAFGEGIDLPDVRNVFLYHLNFDFTEFNQQAGRAGRDGECARIHLLFGQRDRGLNEFIINRAAPQRHTLCMIYDHMKKLSTSRTVRLSNAEIAAMLDDKKIDGSTVNAAIRIFEEVGLMYAGEDDDGRFVTMLEAHKKVDLMQSERYAEGEAERDNFARFAALVLGSQADVLQSVINRPIYPSGVPMLR